MNFSGIITVIGIMGAIAGGLITLISVIAAVVSAVFARAVWQTARKAMLHQAILDVQKDYRSPEILYAVKTLWDFYREHGKDKLVNKYNEKWKQDKEKILQMCEEEKFEAEKATLHYQRRLVSHFYRHLAALNINGILPEDIVYENWTETDLGIIPKIILPLDECVYKSLYGESAKTLMRTRNMQTLYEDSKKYCLK